MSEGFHADCYAGHDYVTYPSGRLACYYCGAERPTCPECGGPHRLPCPERDRVVPLQEVQPAAIPGSAEEWLEDMRRQISKREQEERDGIYTDPESPHPEVP